MDEDAEPARGGHEIMDAPVGLDFSHFFEQGVAHGIEADGAVVQAGGLERFQAALVERGADVGEEGEVNVVNAGDLAEAAGEGLVGSEIIVLEIDLSDLLPLLLNPLHLLDDVFGGAMAVAAALGDLGIGAEEAVGGAAAAGHNLDEGVGGEVEGIEVGLEVLLVDG